jgi:hypothetical protein
MNWFVNIRKSRGAIVGKSVAAPSRDTSGTGGSGDKTILATAIAQLMDAQ